MAVVMTSKTKQQAEAQERLRSVLRNVVRNIQEGLKEAAEVWKECAELGCDMSPKPYVTPEVPLAFLQLVADIADGKILLEVGTKLLSAPRAVRKAMCDVPIPAQERFLEHGVEVWRDGSAQRVQIGELLDHEARTALVDPNSGRTLSAEEKLERSVKTPPTDQELRGVYLTPVQKAEFALACKRRGTTIASVVLSLLVKDGWIEPRIRTRRTATKSTPEKRATNEVGGAQ